ncbi:hypothetical protein [Acinetobacter baumannii]|uniref:hypothetical protein n=1 Tax=Acinetobacter baumannii TaxID=470 RepID=UPI001CDB7BF3|nr:hypothetical protein [Acinetobacter baumannii]MCA4232767.1 hypothetical protein [Acinetobacter baumannii]
MCGGKMQGLFTGGINMLGKNLRDWGAKSKEAAEAEVENKQAKEENAAVAVRKRRASEVLSATDNGKKTTLGG